MPFTSRLGIVNKSKHCIQELSYRSDEMLARIVGRSQKYVDMLKEGWNEVPHLYGSLTIGAVALIAYVYRVAHTPPGGYITRFKERYMVMRPDDPRLIGYPKEYVTDRHLLKD